jgi:hypothetical protein
VENPSINDIRDMCSIERRGYPLCRVSSQRIAFSMPIHMAPETVYSQGYHLQLSEWHCPDSPFTYDLGLLVDGYNQVNSIRNVHGISRAISVTTE